VDICKRRASGHFHQPSRTRYDALDQAVRTARSDVRKRPTNQFLNRFDGGPMTRRNLPNLTFEVVQHDRDWAVWLVVILGGIVGVFALTALIVSLLIHG
jgi:hypothetical protein